VFTVVVVCSHGRWWLGSGSSPQRRPWRLGGGARRRWRGLAHAGAGPGLFIGGGLLASGLREGITPWYGGLGRRASRELAAGQWARRCGRAGE
jgi:hypothetical protein